MSLLTQIHEVITEQVLQHEVDPIRGHIAKRVPVLKPGKTTQIVHDGETYERDDDGTFTLDNSVAEFFLNQPGWFAGPAPIPPEEEKPAAAPKSAARKSPAKSSRD